MTTPLEQLAEILADNSELEIVKKHGLMWIYTDPHELAQAIIDAGWQAPPAQTSGYTTHGHPIPGIAQTGPRPTNRARCGGPRLCKQCKTETN